MASSADFLMESKTTFDLLVVGATAPGIVAAVRAAREGLSVALVASGRHIGDRTGLGHRYTQNVNL